MGRKITLVALILFMVFFSIWLRAAVDCKSNLSIL